MANVNSNICSLQKKHLNCDTKWLKIRVGKKICHTNSKQKIPDILTLM